jgi:hypothetical protein
MSSDVYRSAHRHHRLACHRVRGRALRSHHGNPELNFLAFVGDVKVVPSGGIIKVNHVQVNLNLFGVAVLVCHIEDQALAAE